MNCPGERPYKCNVCGNRFTTKGNLKVHFQRHLEQYPNARMNPDPVPEYLDHHESSYDRQMAPLAHAVSAAGRSAMPSFMSHSATPTKSVVEQAVRSMSASDGSSLTTSRENLAGGVATQSGSGPPPVKMESSSSLIHVHQQQQQGRLPPDSLQTVSTAEGGGDSQFQSPLSALSSMSSALSAFAPQLRMTFPPPPPPPPPPMSTMPLPVPPGAPLFSPFPLDSVPPSLPPPMPPTVSKELDDEDLEQYMEIQHTDTARIEDMMREATAAGTVAGGGGGGRSGDVGAASSGDPNECIICHRVLSCRSALLMHYRTHTGERPYRCRLCGRTFTTKGNLKTHMAVHRGRIAGLAASGAGQHRCRVCRRDFPGSVALQQHVRTAHAPDSMTPASNSPFPFPVSGAGGNAAAMMMMHGVNPLIPFFNFPPFGYHTPRSLLPSPASSSSAGSAPVRPATATQDRDDSGGELDLRKSSSVERDGEGRSCRSDVDDLGEDCRPANKRAKTEDGGAGGEFDGRRLNDVEMMRKLNGHCQSSSKWSSKEVGGFSPVNNDEETNCREPTFREDGPTADTRRNFSFNKDSSASDVDLHDDVRTSDSFQPPIIREEPFPAASTTTDRAEFANRIASKFASPLLALEERVNSLDYSTNMFSRFSMAAAGAGIAYRDQEDFGSGDSCDMEGAEVEHDRCSSDVQDLRMHDYGLTHNDGDDSYAGDGQQLMSSPSAHRLMMSAQSDGGDVGSDDSASSRRSASPGGTVRPSSSGSGASSLSGGVVVPPTALDRSDVVASVVQSSPSSTSTPARYSCQVCAKPFASASALEIHSRTHSGDRPFVCSVCSKAFTTKGNLKVHMSTHAWNKCPSRRGRRMTVVDPAAAAAVAAAASGAFSGSLSAPKDAAAAAAAAAFLSNTFGAATGVRFDAALPPPPPVFGGGFVPLPPGVPGNGAFLSDNNKALLNYCMQAAAAAAAAHGAGREGLASADTVRQAMSSASVGAGGGDWSAGALPWMVGAGAFKDERNNNGRANGSATPARGPGAAGGELDLSARSNTAAGGGSSVAASSAFGDRQTSPAGMRSWTADRGSSLPLISNCT